MRVVFDIDFDDEPWPGPLRASSASAGECWLGACRMIEALETALGLGFPPVPEHARVARLLPRLRATEAPWDRSARVDPIGTARRLLRWRDALRLGGWRGDAPTPRLAALAALAAEDRLGPADRLEAIERALVRRSADLESVDLLEPEAELPLAWRRVLAALRARGTAVREAPLPDAPARGDLALARARPFRPAGDGTIALVRPAGPIAAADEVAAWLAAQPDLEGTVIVSPDALLDRALVRHGLPPTGALPAPADAAVLQVLPLVAALASPPPDPTAARDLLSLAPGPVPPDLARRLLLALRERAAVDSDPWRAALREGLAGIGDEACRRVVAGRIEAIFRPIGRDGLLPLDALGARLDALDGWVAESMAGGAAAARLLAPAAAQIAALRRILDRWGEPSIAASHLARAIDLASHAAPLPPVHPGGAGLRGVARPALVAGPARRVVWWGFARAATSSFPDVPLDRAERDALLRAGVELPDPVAIARRAARRRRRPLLQATEALVLVCPLRGADGEPLDPHPLWDELVSALESPEAGRFLLERAAPSCGTPPRRAQRALRPAPEPRRDWSVSAEAPPRLGKESPASIADLLACPFRWLIDRIARVRPGATAPLPAGPLALGSIAHEVVLGALAEHDGGDPGEAAGRLFDERGPRIAAALFRPGADALRADARRIAVEGARELGRALAAAGMRIEGIERVASGACAAGAIEGRIDLVVSPPRAAIDLKWGRPSDRRAALARGTALQLATYSVLLREAEGDDPPVAYFALRARRLLSTDPRAFPAAEPVRGPAPGETWAAAERALAARRDEVDRGAIAAPGNPARDGRALPDRDAIEGGRLVLAPTCAYCRLDALCGRAFGESA